MSTPYFLKYQRDWILDRSMVKIAEKSRRIGLTFVQSYEDVEDCADNQVPAVWYSGTDESAAREYIEYCKFWAKSLNHITKDLGEIIIDEKENCTAFSLQFKNGNRINALSSNPSAFRSKGGKVILDEFAFHKDANKLWAAAQPVTLWGYPLRILSTHNGQGCKYYKFIQDCKDGKLPDWSLHTTDIYKAVSQGLADKIKGKELTDDERAKWIEQIRRVCADETAWQQEYCCVPVDEATAYLPYELLYSCESSHVLAPNLNSVTGELYVGMDIGRKKDLSVIWVDELLGTVLYTRMVIILEKIPFSKQKEVLFTVLKHPKLRRCCIDATGIGMNLAEDAQEEYGKYTVEAVTFTNSSKAEMASDVRIKLEDKALIIPDDDDIREDWHSIKKTTTAAGNIRYDSVANDAGGHGDRFWAGALAVHAAKGMESATEAMESESTSEVGSMLSRMM